MQFGGGGFAYTPQGRLLAMTSPANPLGTMSSLELVGDLCGLGHIFPGHKQELTFRSLYAALAVVPVLITFIETFCHIFGRPFDD
jgi:hypothetical protein